MAIKDVIGRGLGFAPGSVKYLITHGFDIGTGIWTAKGDQTTPWSPKTDASTGIWTAKANDASSTWATI